MEPIKDFNNFENLPYKCALNIQAIYGTLKTAEKKVADFILLHPDRIKDISIDSFSEEVYSSKATIVRVSRKLGYKGFHDLKSDFLKTGENNDFWEYDDILKSDDPLEVLVKVFNSSIKSIKDTLRMISKNEFLKALDAFLNAKKIMFCGIGDAALVATEACQRFTRLGLECSADTDADIQLLKSSQLGKTGIFFAISYSGRSKPVIECTKIARSSGATIIALTNYPVSPLAKKSDILLQTAVFNTSSTGEVISKRLTELLVVESLYINYILKKINQVKHHIEKSHEVLKINKV